MLTPAVTFSFSCRLLETQAAVVPSLSQEMDSEGHQVKVVFPGHTVALLAKA